MLTQIELHPAFVWDCEECGTENFERAIMPPFQDDEEEELARELCEVEKGEGFPVMCPAEVICRRCDRHFDTDVRYMEDSA